VQASSSSSRVLQWGKEDAERLTVALLQTAKRERDRERERERETEEIEVTVIPFSSVFLFFFVPFHLPQIKLFPRLLCFLFFSLYVVFFILSSLSSPLSCSALFFFFLPFFSFVFRLSPSLGFLSSLHYILSIFPLIFSPPLAPLFLLIL